MKRNVVFCFVLFVCSACLLSCSKNSDELRFMGKNLSVSCKEFKNHLEDNGFKCEGSRVFKGEYLGENVDILLENEKNGHYNKMTIMLTSGGKTCEEYYEKICKEIKKEHNGFKVKDKEENDQVSYTQESSGKDISIPISNKITEFYNDAGKKVHVSLYDAVLVSIVTAIYELNS